MSVGTMFATKTYCPRCNKWYEKGNHAPEYIKPRCTFCNRLLRTKPRNAVAKDNYIVERY